MTATKGLGTYGNAAGTVTPLDHKMAQLGLVVKSSANTIRPGLFWDGSATIVSGKANMSYDVRAFSAVLSRSSTAGAVLLTNDAVLNISTDVTGAALVAPGSNSRYHLVFAWQREYSLDGTDSNPVIGVLQGTAAASPTVPSLASYPGAIELARILVPAGVTATNSGTTITQTAPFTAASGGVVVVRSTTERDGTSPYAASAWAEGQIIWLLDTDKYQRYNGSSWSDLSPAGVAAAIASSTSGTLDSATGYVTFSGASSVSLDGVFTSSSKRYEIEWCVVFSGAATMLMQLRASSSTNSSAVYDRQVFQGVNATAAAAQALAQTSWSFVGLAGTQDATVNLSNPADSGLATTGNVVHGSTPNPMTTSAGEYHTLIQHRTAAAYDGFILTPSTGTMSGFVRVLAK